MINDAPNSAFCYGDDEMFCDDIYRVSQALQIWSVDKSLQIEMSSFGLFFIVWSTVCGFVTYAFFRTEMYLSCYTKYQNGMSLPKMMTFIKLTTISLKRHQLLDGFIAIGISCVDKLSFLVTTMKSRFWKYSIPFMKIYEK